MYDHFADIYDEFMQTVSYEEWADYMEALWQKHGTKKPELILDLACGTGNLTVELVKRGYDLIAADQSAQMLEIAREKLSAVTDRPILYLQQDMRELELYGTVDAVLCTCDSLNYLLEEKELAQVFRLVENYLEPGGLFIFDLNTEYKYAELLGDQTFADTAEDAAFIWQNYYYEDEKINEYQVTFFQQEEDGRYQRNEETHYQKAYSIETVRELLEQSGLRVLGVYDAFTMEAARPDSERVCYVAGEYLYEQLGKKRQLASAEWRI